VMTHSLRPPCNRGHLVDDKLQAARDFSSTLSHCFTSGGEKSGLIIHSKTHHGCFFLNEKGFDSDIFFFPAVRSVQNQAIPSFGKSIAKEAFQSRCKEPFLFVVGVRFPYLHITGCSQRS
ncbi:MAG: hypothetical protein ACOY3I_04870, partial [Verrucomicrobiota bacterium]